MIKENKKLTLTISIAIGLTILLGIGAFFVIDNSQKNKLVECTINNETFEVYSTISLNDFQIETKGGEILFDNYEFDTSSIGPKTATIFTKNKKGTVHEYELHYNVVDTTAPVIENLHDMTFLLNTELDFTKILRLNDNLDKEVKFTIDGTYDNTTVGTYNLTATVSDSSNNEATLPFTVSFIECPIEKTSKGYIWPDMQLTTEKGYIIDIIDNIAYIEGMQIINKTFTLPSTYNKGLQSEASAAFELMKSDAQALGLSLKNSSGFRTYSYQDYLYNYYTDKYGRAYTDTISARPGSSEHQSGYAIDLNTITGAFAYTDEGKWVVNNCHNYGFIIRYPQDKSNETGYAYEPWHIRYVGQELATILYNGGDWITVEDYYGIQSAYLYNMNPPVVNNNDNNTQESTSSESSDEITDTDESNDTENNTEQEDPNNV